jgi:hypothetical protein
MIETITPAVCGSRRRQRLAFALFALGALLASAVLGALLGLAGGRLGLEHAVLAVAVLALAAAAREAGILRVPLPQSRRQVPDRWRGELPLPVWSFGYGAGLGVGFATFQPVSTFWVACAGALALGRPLTAAGCLSLYGLGRVLMVTLPSVRAGDAGAAVEGLAQRRDTLARANSAVLLACAALLFAAPATAAAPVRVTAGFDPSVSPRVLAHARMNSGASRVIVRPRDATPVQIDAARSPSVDGNLVAYVGSDGIRVVDWQTARQVAEVDGAVSAPALDWPLLAFVRRDASNKKLILRDLKTGKQRLAAYVSLGDDLGRPALRGGRLAWQRTTRKTSRIVVLKISSWTRRLIARTRIGLLSSPALSRKRILWIDQRRGVSRARVRRLAATRTATLWSTSGNSRLFWTTALAGRTAYVTRWSLATGAASVYRLTF